MNVFLAAEHGSRIDLDLALIVQSRRSLSSLVRIFHACCSHPCPDPPAADDDNRAKTGRDDKIKSREMPDKPKGAGVRRSSDAEFSRGKPQPFVCWRNATTDFSSFSSFSTDEWRSLRVCFRWLA